MFNIYCFIALVLFLCSLYTFPFKASSNKVLNLLKLFIFFLILYEGLRWQIGTDWEPYYNGFINGYNEDVSHIEIGFVWLNNFIRSITLNYTIFIFILTSFFYIVLYSIIKQYSVKPLMSLCIYYCSMLGLLGCYRQLIALFICLLSLKYIVNRQFFTFLIFIILAFAFHTTALVFLPAYFLVTRKIESKIFVCLLLVCLLIGLSGIINSIPYVDLLVYLDGSSMDKLNSAAEGDVSAYSYIGTIKRLIITIPCLIVRRKNGVSGIYDGFIKLYLMGVLVFLIFNGSVLQLMAGRGALYYNIFEILIIPYLFTNLVKQKKVKLVVWAIYFCLLMFVMIKGMDYYVEDNKDIYRPYKTVLFS